MGLDPKIAAIPVRLVLKEIKAGTLTYAAFVEKLLSSYPQPPSKN